MAIKHSFQEYPLLGICVFLAQISRFLMSLGKNCAFIVAV